MLKSKTFKDIIIENKIFLILYLCFLIYGAFRLSLFPKGADLLWLNAHNSWFLDLWFRFWTLIGDGVFFVSVLIPILWIRIRYSIIGLFSFISSGLTAQILKRIFDVPRPKVYFQGLVDLYFVPGVHVYSQHSFPSGHTASGFALFLFLTAISKNKNWSYVYFFMALCIGYSRIYLSQHFFIDVYFGSMVGVAHCLLFIYLIENLAFLKNKEWLDCPIHKCGKIPFFNRKKSHD